VLEAAGAPPLALPPEAAVPQPRAASTAAGQIEVELPDGSKLRVGADVGLVALRRVLAALRR
jgi:transposase